MTPSPYQQAIFDWIRNGSGSAVVQAVAGSGKSTTLIEGSRLVTGHGRFVAFNKRIVTDLDAKLSATGGGKMRATTFHALGFAAIRRTIKNVSVDDDKYEKIVRRLLYPGGLPANTNRTILRTVLEVVRRIRTQRLVLDDRGVRALIVEVEPYLSPITINGRKFTVAETLDAIVTLIAATLDEGHRTASTVIDFTDMVCLPLELGLSIPKYPWLFIDECQDLSAAQRDLALASLAPGGRALAVGDPAQAINAFAGADADSLDRIQAALNARSFPLSICYRCPSRVVEVAQALHDDIEEAPGAAEGHVWAIDPEQAPREMRHGDLVLARRTAPLIDCWFKFLGTGLRARVVGRDLGRALISAGNEIAAAARSWKQDALVAATPGVISAAVARAVAENDGIENPAKIERLVDRYEGAKAALIHLKPVNEIDYETRVRALFSDTDEPDPAQQITLSSIHRAKGLQAQRVFLLEPDWLDVLEAEDGSRAPEQEKNLQYVAVTRAQSEFFFVGPPWKEAWGIAQDWVDAGRNQPKDHTLSSPSL